MATTWLVSVTLAALAQRIPFKEYTNFRPGPGMAQIEALAQDRDGAIWVVASEGVYRWDGSRFTDYPEVRETGSGWNVAQVGSNGSVWVFSADAAMRWNGVRFWKVPIAGLGEIQSPNAVALSERGWYMATSKGIQLAEPDSNGLWKARVLAIPKSDLSVSPMVESDPANRSTIWFRCQSSVCRWDGKETTEFGEAAGVPKQFWLDLLAQKDGTLWARSSTSLIRMPVGSKRFEPVATAEAQTMGIARLVAIAENSVGVPFGSGFNRYKSGSRDAISLPGVSGMPTAGVTTALYDREGSIWLALSGSGLIRLLGDGRWTQFGESAGVLARGADAMAGGGKGELWASGTGPWLLYGPPSASSGQARFQTVPFRAPGAIKSIAPGRDGTAWIGVSDGRVFRATPSTVVPTVLSQPALDQDDFLNGLMLDNRDRLWIMRKFDLARLDPPYSQPKTIVKQRTFRAAQCSPGRIWVTAGTSNPDDPTLILVDNEITYTFGISHGLPVGPALDVACAPDGSAVVTYLLTRAWSRVGWDGTRLTVQNFNTGGLRPNYAGFDEAGRLWLASDRAISVEAEPGKWERFDQANGLGWNHVSGNFVIHGKSLWVSTPRGLSHYDIPDRIPVAAAPQATITGVHSSSKALDPKQSVVFEPDDGDVTVEFSTSSSRSEERTVYRYRIREISLNWRETEEPQAKFPQLKYGHYRFEVQARSHYDEWSSAATASLDFQVLPHWYETWWFQILVITGAGLLAWSAVQFRTRYLRERQKVLEAAVQDRTASLVLEKQKTEDLLADAEELKLELRDLSARRDTLLENERKRISREIHDELGQLLTGLKLRLNFLQSKAGGKDEHLSDLLEQTDHTIQTVRRIASELRPPVLDHFGLGAAIEWQVSEFSKMSGLKANCLVPDKLSTSADLSITVFRILQEALTNIGRHANAKNVDVLLTVEGSELVLQIVDDGRGITRDQKQGRRSLGLLGMSERATAVGGVVEIRRLEEGGTVVEARFPLGPHTAVGESSSGAMNDVRV